MSVRKITKNLVHKIVLLLFLTSQFSGLSLLFPQKLEGANLSSVSDTLSNNRLSFRGQLDGAVAAGTGLIVLKTSGLSAQNTSTGSAALMTNENLKVGTNPPYAVKTIDTDTRVFLGTALGTTAADGSPVIATVSAVHTVTFTPASAINGGAFRVLIPAYSSALGDLGDDDGLPHPNGFDMGAVDVTGPSSDVTCTGGGVTFPVAQINASASAVAVGTTTYHAFECRYYGVSAIGTPVTMTIGSPSGAKLINPSPASTTRYPGQADTYSFRVQHLDAGDSYGVTDQTLGTIGVVEAVRVTATVLPTLVFTMTGVTADAGTYCNVSRSASSPDTTTQSVPFGNISTTAFTDAVQILSISTNAGGGYVVTASESGLLTAYSVTGTPTIADTTCGGSCTTSTAAEWNTVTQRGFGYALQNVTGTPVTNVSSTLPYNYSGRTFNARPFGTTGASIMTNTAAVDVEQAYVCYRVVVSGSQAAGDYENYVVYIATATF